MANAAQFDTAFYLSTYPDVAVAISRGQFASAQDHYNQFGRFESRNPNAYFDTTFYLTQNADVAANRGNPFEHFVNFGSKEGRFSNNAADAAIDTNNNNRADEFDSAAYLAANQDVANNVGEGKAFATAYQHFILFGQFESRAGTPAGGPFTNTGTAPNTGTTTVFTTNIDTLTGTNGNDTFIGDANTVSAADRVNGGAGVDTLTLSDTSTLPTLSNVERIELTNNTAASVLNASGVTGLTEVVLKSGLTTSAITTASGVVTTLDATGTAATAVAAVTVATAATATAQTIQVTNGSNITTLTANGAAVNNLTIQSNGSAANTIGSLDGSSGATALANSTLTIAGSQKLTVTSALDTDFTTVNAGASTGGVDLTFGANTVTATGGSGNDRFSFDGNLGAGDTLVGGAGTDTVAIAGQTLAAGATLTALNTKVSGFEVLEFTGNVATTITGGTGTDAFTNAEITKILFNTDAADTINNAGSVRTYAFGDANTGAATLNLGSGVNTVNVSLESTTAGADIDGLTVAANAAAPAGQTATINLASIGGGTPVNTTGAIDVAIGSTIKVTGSHDLTIASLTNGGTIDASAFTGKLIATGSGANDVITGGTNNDTLTGGAGIDTINGGAGNDTITGGTGADVLTGGAGADIFKFAAGDSAANGTSFDTITDFAKASDVIDHTASITFVTNATASAGVAAINAEGIATFNAADTTLAQQITAVEAAIQTGTAAAGQAAIFQSGADSYVFISDGTDGVGANDVLIKLTGVTGLTDSTLTSGDLTIA